MTTSDGGDHRSLPVTFIGDQSLVVADASALPEACRKLESSGQIHGDADRSCDERQCSRWCTYWENPREPKDSTADKVVKEEVAHSGPKHHCVAAAVAETQEKEATRRDDAWAEKDREEESADEEDEDDDEEEEEKDKREEELPEETAEVLQEKYAKRSSAAVAAQVLGPLNIIAAAIPVDWCACPEGVCDACDRYHDGCGGRCDGEPSDECVSCSQNFEIVIEYSDESAGDADGQAAVADQQQQCVGGGGARKRKTANAARRSPKKRKK